MSLSAARWRLGSRDGALSFVVVGYLLALAYSAVILLPLYYLVVSAFKTNLEIFGDPLGLPVVWDLSNFVRAEESVGLLGAIGRSFTITLGAEVVTLMLAFPAAFAIARIPVRVAAPVEVLFGFGLLIPAFAVLVPVFLFAAASGLLYNPVVLILFYPATRLPISILLLAAYLRTIPRELEEAAQIDGASRAATMWRVFFPLATPAVVTVIVLNFIAIWNEFLFAFILLDSDSRTAQVAVPLLKSERAVDFGMLAAGVLMTLVPVYVVFIVFQRRIQRGMLAGSVKQ
jgi:multiple sugar transport system permease protein